MKPTHKVWAGLFLACFLYLSGAALLGNWIIDDAGISFAYSRNLASGYGLVAQPGRVPVEGFSNFLWVLVLAPTFLLRIFDPIWTPKALAFLLFALSLAAVEHVLRKSTQRLLPGVFSCCALALSPPLVIWTASGLENGLLLFLVTGLWALVILAPPRWPLYAGAVAGLVAMTRPDGLVFAGAVPCFLILTMVFRRGDFQRKSRQLLESLAATLAVIVPFFSFRLLYFGKLWPHPYYAKKEWDSQTDRLLALVNHPAQTLQKVTGVFSGTAGWPGPVLIIAALAVTLWLLKRRALPRHIAVTALLFGFAAFGFIWLENDWMGEYRFATPLAVMVVLLLFCVIDWLGARSQNSRRRTGAVIAASVLLASLALSFIPRTWAFAQCPPTPYREVSNSFARRFNDYAAALGVKNGSILVADGGAMLMESKLEVYDATGLFEPAVVELLKRHTRVWNYDHPEFFDWVFERIKPTFIATHAYWTNVTAFEHDKRFHRDYAAIDAYHDSYVSAQYGRDLHSGEFVRRDALPAHMDVENLRATYLPRTLPPSPVSQITDFAWRLRGKNLTANELKTKAESAKRCRRIELLRKTLELAPEDIPSAQFLAQELDAATRTAEAREVWRKLLETASKGGLKAHVFLAETRLTGVGATVHQEITGPSNPDSASVEDLLALSRHQYEKQQYAESITTCKKILAIRPNHAEAYNNICASFLAQKQWSDGIEACTLALHFDPSLQIARNNLLWAQTEMRQSSSK